MVAIRRKTQHRKNAKSGICTIRNVILVSVFVQGIRLLGRMTTFSSTTTSGNDAGHSKPVGIQNVLQDSKQSIRGGGGGGSKNNNNNNNNIPKPPPLDTTGHEIQQRPPIVQAGGDSGTGKSSHNSDPDPFHDPDEHQLPDDPVDEMHHDLEILNHPNNNKINKNTPDGTPTIGDPIHKIVLDKRGTGPTKVGYVKDFDHEREHPAFRTMTQQQQQGKKDVSKQVAAAVEETSVKPCLDETTGDFHATCLDPDAIQIAYNAMPFPRSWCGTDIDAGTPSTLHQHCTDPIVHLFPMQTIPISGHGMPPMIIQSHEEKIQESDLETIECDIPCKQEMGLSGDIRYIHGEPWQIVEPQGDNYLNGLTKIERTGYRHDIYFSTQSFVSSVPRPMFDWKQHSLRNKPATDFGTAKNKAFYLVDKACASASTKRQKYFDAMKRVFPIDSYGKCHHNTNFPSNMDINNHDDRIAVMSQYKIVLAFDVSSDKDHISSYIWEALQSGAVPVVIGADNIKDHLPPNSFVRGGDFGGWDDLAVYVKGLAANETLWNSYHEWRDDEDVLNTLEQKYEFAKTEPACRLCRWAYAKKYGLGWNHYQQQVTNPKMDRQLCISSSSSSSKSFISKPFQEVWVAKHDHDDEVLSAAAAEEASNNCDSTRAETTIDADSFKLERTVVEHDGVTDIRLTDIEHRNTDGQIVFRLHFAGIRNSEGACFHNTHTLVGLTTPARSAKVSSASLQDEFVKVTVLADWETDITSTAEGILEIVVLQANEVPPPSTNSHATKRIRIITEDTSEIHDKMTEFFPSSFAKRIIQDFVDPLEIFYADS